MKYIVHIALVIGVFNGLFWELLPKGSYYVLNSLLLFLLCLYIFLNDKKSFIKFVLLGLSISNLLDELRFDPTKLHLNEIVVALLLPIIWYLKKKL